MTIMMIIKLKKKGREREREGEGVGGWESLSVLSLSDIV